MKDIMKNQDKMRVYQVYEMKWSGGEYDPIKEKPLKTFLYEKTAEKFREFKKKTKEFHPQAKYYQISYGMNVIEVCKDTDFKEPSMTEFLKNKKKHFGEYHGIV